jgi:rod shape-determining protein MreD
VLVAVAGGAALLTWALTSLLTFRLLPIGPALLQFGLTAGLYPLLAVLFTRAHRGLAAPEQA